MDLPSRKSDPLSDTTFTRRKGEIMKRSLLVLVGLALVGVSLWAASVASSAPVIRTEAMAPGLLSLPRATPAGQTSLYGHIASLSRQRGRWMMRFDPALLLRGVTAAQAALEDTGSSDVPNDSYTLDESHRLLTYVVSPTATVTVLLQELRPIEIPVSELAQITQGKNPRRRALFDRARGLGYWIRVGDKYPNPVLSIDQQYHP
jgi:hypothetical protein